MRKFKKVCSFTGSVFEVVNEDIIAYSLKLNQVFINLLSNAVKHTPAGVLVFCAKPMFISDLKTVLLVADNLPDKQAEVLEWNMADLSGNRILLEEEETGYFQMIKKIKQKTENFNLGQICKSGQCFRMKEKSEGLYSVIAGKRYLELEQQGEDCIFYCGEAEFHDFWEEYFDLKGDYASYINKIVPDDTYLRNAAEFGSGIRILRQDLWEMIVSFLISQQNNIARIRRCIENICERYGERLVNCRGEAFYAFPAPEALADLEENALMECNLGYRSKYVVRTARSVTSGEFNLEAVRQLPYRAARAELLKLFGVGEKVADCICLFALHKLEAFPVDTHINQALQSHYKRGFPMRRYSGIQGVLQQYIFYYELAGNKIMPQ